MYDGESVRFYDAQLEPCPFCGGAEQHVFGFRVDSGWRWSVTCMSCGSATGDRDTEQDALNLWNRETRKEAEVSDEEYDRWCACRQRFVNELTSRVEGR